MSPNAKEQAHSLPGAPSEFVAANFKAVIEALDLGPEASRSDYQITARNKVKEAHPEVFRIESEATTQAAVKEDAEAEDKSLTTSYVVVPSTTEIDIDAIVKAPPQATVDKLKVPEPIGVKSLNAKDGTNLRDKTQASLEDISALDASSRIEEMSKIIHGCATSVMGNLGPDNVTSVESCATTYQKRISEIAENGEYMKDAEARDDMDAAEALEKSDKEATAALNADIFAEYDKVNGNTTKDQHQLNKGIQDDLAPGFKSQKETRAQLVTLKKAIEEDLLGLEGNKSSLEAKIADAENDKAIEDKDFAKCEADFTARDIAVSRTSVGLDACMFDGLILCFEKVDRTNLHNRRGILYQRKMAKLNELLEKCDGQITKYTAARDRLDKNLIGCDIAANILADLMHGCREAYTTRLGCPDTNDNVISSTLYGIRLEQLSTELNTISIPRKWEAVRAQISVVNELSEELNATKKKEKKLFKQKLYAKRKECATKAAELQTELETEKKTLETVRNDYNAWELTTRFVKFREHLIEIFGPDHENIPPSIETLKPDGGVLEEEEVTLDDLAITDAAGAQ